MHLGDFGEQTQRDTDVDDVNFSRKLRRPGSIKSDFAGDKGCRGCGWARAEGSSNRLTVRAIVQPGRA